MDDGTSEPKRCTVCGDPIRPDNQIGICGDKAKKACLQARRREKRRRMADAAPPKPEPERCSVCGDPIRSDNRSGICNGRGKPACQQARNQRFAEQGSVRSKPAIPKADARYCDVCGCPIRRDNATGVCGDPWKAECRAERKRRKDAGLMAERRPAVTSGELFGRWTALESSDRENGRVLCRCECGTEGRVQARRLVLGLSLDCGCEWKRKGALKRFPNPYIAAGSVFGRLTVLEDVRREEHDKARCMCECGTEVVIGSPATLKAGHTMSCGCLRRERITTHGLSAHPLYKVWRGMLSRCENPKADSYQNYSEEGIQVCEAWHDVAVFIDDIFREIGPRPEGVSPGGMPLYTLDRYPDNSGNYEPGNVRWATQSQQVINQRKVRILSQENKALMAELAALKASLGLA